MVHPRPHTTIVSLRSDSEKKRSTGTSVSGDDLASALDDLGIRAGHYLLADLIVLVEGIYGVCAVEEWIDKHAGLEEIQRKWHIVCHQFNVTEARSCEFDLGRVRQINRNVVFFFDRDDGSKPHNDLETACGNHEPPLRYVRLKNGKIEDLFPESAIRRAFPEEFDGWKCDSTNGSPWDQYKKHLCGNPKHYNRLIAAAMTQEEMDSIPEIVELVKCITDMLNGRG